MREETLRLLEQAQAPNFGLYYYRKIFWENEAEFKKAENGPEEYRKYYDKNVANPGSRTALLLKNKHDLMNAFMKGYLPSFYAGITARAKLSSPLVAGIGQAHVNETGMTFDRNTGLPFFPGSSLKGLSRFRHTLRKIEEANPQTRTDQEGEKFVDLDEVWARDILSLYGSPNQRGRVVFMDSYPESVPRLGVDILNPHYSKYYTEGLPPSDTMGPIPVKFLVVKPGTTFVFRMLYRKDDEALKQSLIDTLQQVLTADGIGAKTSSGFGRFTGVSFA